MFRNFIYLDEIALSRYATQLGLLDKAKMAPTKANFGGKIGALSAGVELEARSLPEDVAVLYDNFEKELAKKSQEEYFDFIEADPASDEGTLPLMSIVRFRGTAEIPEAFDLLSTMSQFAPMLDSVGLLETDSADVPKELVLCMLKGEGASVPLLMDGIGIPVFAKLKTQYLTDSDLSDLEDLESEEAVFLFKVLSRRQGKRVEIYDPLKEFMKLNRAARRNMKRTEGLEALELEGPVLKAELIAIYH